MKRRNLGKFRKQVDRFFKNTITGRQYRSELTQKYQNRFLRYHDSLFTFLEQDGIPWHNNTAERAIRYVAIQRDISSHFSKAAALDYLLLLGIRQTCLFQGKSFFKLPIDAKIYARCIAHCQQSVEKALKAALAVRDVIVTDRHEVSEDFRETYTDWSLGSELADIAATTESIGFRTEYPLFGRREYHQNSIAKWMPRISCRRQLEFLDLLRRVWLLMWFYW